MMQIMNTMVPHWIQASTSAVLLFAFGLAPALAQQNLGQALDAAWQRQPHTAALAARQAETKALGEVAASLTPGPAEVSLGHRTDRMNNNEGMREWEVELATPLWLPGQRSARQTVANRHSLELAARTALQRWQLAGELREAWWAVAAARAGQTQARQRLETAEALAANVQRRHAKGDLARLDANLAQAEKLAAQAELLDAQQALQQAEQALQHLTGLPAPAQLPPEQTVTQTGEQTGAHPAPHPLTEALRAGAALADSRVALADASRRDAPELALSWISERGQVGRAYERTLGIKLSWPLSSSGLVQQESAAARAELAQADAEVALASARIDVDIARARAELAAVEQQLAMAQERQKLTTDNLTLAQRSFDLGEADLPALLRARADALAAQTHRASQEVAQARAVSRLHQAQGLLP